MTCISITDFDTAVLAASEKVQKANSVTALNSSHSFARVPYLVWLDRVRCCIPTAGGMYSEVIRERDGFFISFPWAFPSFLEFMNQRAPKRTKKQRNNGYKIEVVDGIYWNT